VHYERDEGPLDYLKKAARCYAGTLRHSPNDVQTHLALGLVFEEMFYAEDLFGLTPDEPIVEEEGQAEASSKEEEFLAICKLHGVPSSPQNSSDLTFTW